MRTPPVTSRARASYYPAMLDLVDRRAVVIGGGTIAARKVDELLASGAAVHVVAPKACVRIEVLAAAGALTLISRSYREGDLANAQIAIVATSDSAIQQRAWHEAHALRIFVNTVDEANRCSFITPSILRRGSLTVAVSTNGRNPGLARRIREWLETQFPASFGRFVDLSARARARLRERGVSYDDRSRFAAELFESHVPALVNADKPRDADRLLLELESKYVPQKRKAT
jgi:siroheme synthase-like protein